MDRNHKALAALATGAITLVPVRRWPAPVRAAYVLAPAALLGFGAAAMLASREEQGGRGGTPDVDAPPAVTPLALAGGIGAAGAAYGLGRLSVSADGWIEDRLRDWGVPQPRLVMAVLAAAIMALPDPSDEPVVSATGG
ncbi:hypothetical protein [Arsenicicoccus sp. UBA7492]|jgi:hypothetical protein|uniref:hypothetical protein n=1 Tax=Arsenicicoccus sp. UBA7492 TaxID=1946057 RepID=UPI00257DED0E|nr:hypothetical protein [Arsenicicoccus sp. UBA7492]